MSPLVSQVWIPVALLVAVCIGCGWYYLRKDLADKAAYAPPTAPEPESDPLLTDHPTLVSRRLPGGDCVKCKRVAAEPLSVWCGACEEEINGQGPRPACLRCGVFPQTFNSPWCVGCRHNVAVLDAADTRTLEEK